MQGNYGVYVVDGRSTGFSAVSSPGTNSPRVVAMGSGAALVSQPLNVNSGHRQTRSLQCPIRIHMQPSFPSSTTPTPSHSHPRLFNIAACLTSAHHPQIIPVTPTATGTGTLLYAAQRCQRPTRNKFRTITITNASHALHIPRPKVAPSTLSISPTAPTHLT